MTRNPTAVSPQTTIREAQERMDERGIHHLLVEEQDEVLGILCACDLRNRPPGDTVAAHMTSPVRSLAQDATLDEAAEIMRSEELGCLMVASGGGVNGIVTRTDLRRAGVPLERLAQRFCAACRWDHDVIADGEEGVPFCLDCLERTHPVHEEFDLGCTD